MSLFPWAMIFVGLGVLGAAGLALVGWRLWRGFKALGRDAAAAGQSLARVGVARGSGRDR